MHDSKQEDVDYYLGTLARCEPDLHSIDTGAGWASIAISLKRIADSMEQSMEVQQRTQTSIEELLILLKAAPPWSASWP